MSCWLRCFQGFQILVVLGSRSLVLEGWESMFWSEVGYWGFIGGGFAGLLS